MELNFKVLGEGKPMVILHGLLGTLDNWMTLSKQFAALGFKVYLVDQRNHGKSPHAAEHTYQAMGDDLFDFIEQHFIVDPIILGHSMGGKTVMRFAQDHPRVAEKLIIVDIAPRFYEPHHQHILAGLKAIDVVSLKNRNEADEKLTQFVPNFGERQFLLKNLNRTPEGYSWKCNLPVITEQINNIGESQYEEGVVVDTKTLFLRGDQSSYIESDDISLIQTMFSNVEIMTIANAGHWVHAEQPKEFYEIVKGFIA